MDHKCGSIAVVSAADGTDHRSPEEEELGQQALHNVVLACSRTASVVLVTYSFAVAAWRAHRDRPGDVAFVAGAYAALAALLLCLRRAEQLTPAASPAGERQRLQAAVWALSTALSCAFAYRVSRLVPAALVVVIWSMTSLVVLFGFYVLVLCKDQQCQSVDDVDCDIAGDCKPLIIKKIRPTEEMV